MKTRITQLLFVLLFSIGSARTTHAQDVLANADIIAMAKMGMGDAIIIRQIENSKNNFIVSTSALMEMKQAGLSDTVLAKVIEAAKDDSRKSVDLNDPYAPHRPGIYYKNALGDLVELNPSVTAQNKTKGNLLRGISYGIAKSTVVSRVSGIQARTRCTGQEEFYFYFNQQTAGFDQNTISFYGFLQATSPNEFTLAKFDMAEGSRELETGSGNDYTEELGIDEKHARPFTFEQIAPGIFKVRANGIVSGEYCFVYSGAAPNGYNQQKVYDFSVQ